MAHAVRRTTRPLPTKAGMPWPRNPPAFDRTAAPVLADPRVEDSVAEAPELLGEVALGDAEPEPLGLEPDAWAVPGGLTSNAGEEAKI